MNVTSPAIVRCIVATMGRDVAGNSVRIATDETAILIEKIRTSSMLQREYDTMSYVLLLPTGLVVFSTWWVRVNSSMNDEEFTSRFDVLE